MSRNESYKSTLKYIKEGHLTAGAGSYKDSYTNIFTICKELSKWLRDNEHALVREFEPSHAKYNSNNMHEVLKH